MTALLLLMLAFCPQQPVASPEGREAEFNAIVEKVVENEAKLRNYEAAFEHRVKDFAPPPNQNMIVFIKEIETKVFKHDGLYKLEESGKEIQPLSNETLILRITSAFDGEKTRAVNGYVDGDQFPIANIRDGNRGVTDIWPIHLRLFKRPPIGVPLSVYLRSGPSLRQHPHADDFRENFRVDNSYVGDETVQGLKCFKIRSNLTFKTHDTPTGVRWLWISPERNYQVVRMEYYSPKLSETLPLLVGFADRFIEVKPGIWFPTVFDIQTFDEDSVASKKPNIRVIDKEFVKDIKLDAEHNKQFFSDVPIPAGTSVYEVGADGKIKRSYIEGKGDR